MDTLRHRNTPGPAPCLETGQRERPYRPEQRPSLSQRRALLYVRGMAGKVLFVTPSNAPAGYFVSLSDGTNELTLAPLKADATAFSDAEAAVDQRNTLMLALRPDGRHLALSVDIRPL